MIHALVSSVAYLTMVIVAVVSVRTLIAELRTRRRN